MTPEDLDSLISSIVILRNRLAMLSFTGAAELARKLVVAAMYELILELEK